MGLFKNMKDAVSGAGTGAMTMPSMDDVSAVNAQGQEYRRLSQVGRSGNAVITSATDSGERAAGNTVADLEMQVTPEGGDSYPVALRYPSTVIPSWGRGGRLLHMLSERTRCSVWAYAGA